MVKPPTDRQRGAGARRTVLRLAAAVSAVGSIVAIVCKAWPV
ncbi:MAG: hypothetical protein AB7R89_01190 [Dehalococcoidia bacterium]|jgi:hypothetical protein